MNKVFSGKVLFPLSILIQLYHATSSFRCPQRQQICSCTVKHGQPLVADCTNKNLTKIPQFNRPYRKLIFKKNQLVELTQWTFSPIEQLNVTELVISYCDISSVSPKTFRNLTTMRILDISFNTNISLPQFWISTDLPRLNITELNLSGISLYKSNVLFKGYIMTTLRSLYLRNCDLQKLPSQVFRKFEKLKELDISGNNFGTIGLDISIFNGLKQLTAANCSLHTMPLKHSISNIEILDISWNTIHTVEKGHLMPVLKNLNLDSNALSQIKPSMFSDFKSLTSLSMGNIRTKGAHFDGINSSSLTVLDISGSNFIHRQNLNIFKQSRNIQNLSMDSIDLSVLNDSDMHNLFKPLCEKLRNLSMSRTSLTVLPSTAFNCFEQLSVLDLSRNSISGWENTTFSNISLRKLKLSYNEITIINKSSFSPNLLENISILDVRHNPFSCSCEIHWFRQWMRGQYYKVGGKFGTDLKCGSPPHRHGTNVVDYDPHYEDCFPLDTAFIVAIVVNVCLLFSVSLINCFVKRNFDSEEGLSKTEIKLR